MSELTLLNKGLPAHLKTVELDETTKALMGGGGGDSKRISIEGGVWRMMVNGKEVAQNEERSMNVVIVAAAPKVSRIYYAGTYKKGVVTPPDCWSADGDFPDAKAKNPQAKKCADCPQNIKGSGQNESRACRFQQRLAVVLENDVAGDVYQLTLPATSIFGAGENGKWPLQTYAKMIASKGAPITSVVTEMRFDTNSSTPKLTFKPTRFLETDEFNDAITQGTSPDAIKAITMTVAQADGVKDADSGEAFESAPAPKAQAASVADAAEEEDTPEPTKRTSKKAEAPAPKKDVSKILEEWDDE
jgi:hypothetical protein